MKVSKGYKDCSSALYKVLMAAEKSFAKLDISRCGVEVTNCYSISVKFSLEIKGGKVDGEFSSGKCFEAKTAIKTFIDSAKDFSSQLEDQIAELHTDDDYPVFQVVTSSELSQAKMFKMLLATMK